MDFFERGVRVFGDESFRCHHEPGSAETALQGIMFDEPVNDVIHIIFRDQGFDGFDFFTLTFHGEPTAREDRFAINDDGANAHS